MLKDPVGALFYGRLADTFLHYQLVALDDQDAIIGKVHSVPFAWGGSDGELPARGWDGILEQAFSASDKATARRLTPTQPIVPAVRRRLMVAGSAAPARCRLGARGNGRAA
jgi:hypothetical protein